MDILLDSVRRFTTNKDSVSIECLYDLSRPDIQDIVNSILSEKNMHSIERYAELEKIIEMKPIIGQGTYGCVREWNDKVVIKIEDNYKSQFITDMGINKKYTDILVIEGLAPKIINYMKCRDRCITFMEKITGKTAREVLNGADINQFMSIVKLIISALTRIHELIPYGHGDVHFNNIIVENGKITFIDFELNKRVPQIKDWKKLINLVVVQLYLRHETEHVGEIINLIHVKHKKEIGEFLSVLTKQYNYLEKIGQIKEVI